MTEIPAHPMIERFPENTRGKTCRIGPKQLRRLHALWCQWTGSLGLLSAADRQLRHYYIGSITRGRAGQTRELTEFDAAQVIQWLRKRVRESDAAKHYAAGTAGRHGYPEQREVPPSRAAWRAVWGCAAALGMKRSDLESFIRRHYAGAGLRGLADLRTMADLNRVLWGLKAIARRGREPRRFSHSEKRAA